MSIYHIITNQLQFITPRFYKERYFKNLKNLTKDNYSQKNIEPELMWIKDFLNADAVMLDIGSNNGSFLYQLEGKLSPKNLYAFEPNEKLYNRLRRIFPKIKSFCIALSDQNGTAAFKIPIIKGKNYDSRGTLQIGYREEDEEKHVLHQVKMLTLDDWQKSENLTKINFIKIDVEGNEMKTLEGAKQVIAKFRPTLMVEMEQRHHSEPIWDLIAQIESWEYAAYFLNRTTFNLERLSETIILEQNNNRLINKTAYINNIIFVPNPPKTF